MGREGGGGEGGRRTSSIACRVWLRSNSFVDKGKRVDQVLRDRVVCSTSRTRTQASVLLYS